MITSNQIIDSDRRCPHCSKLMMLEIGQDDISGWTRQVHSCWSCGYDEIDENWPRPRLVPKSGPTLAERLTAQRLGIEIPVSEFVYPDEVPETYPEASDA